MDPHSSAGNSPLLDGDKNDSNDDDSGLKKQQQMRPQGQNQGQQTTPRKGGVPQQLQQGVGQQANWRAGVPSNQGGGIGQGPSQNASMGGQGPAGVQGAGVGQHRFPGKPRMQQPGMGGGPGVVPGQVTQGGMGQGNNQTGNPGAWSSNTGFYPQPRATRFQQAPTLNMNSNQGAMPQGAMGMGGHYGQQQQQQQQNNMGMAGSQGGYGGPRGMQGMMQAGMGGGAAGMMPGMEQLSKTNLYIRGLPVNTTDRDLYNMCCIFGNINSTKAIIDKMNNQCKGYGFVDFENPQAADRGLKDLTARGMQVQMAKIRVPQEQMQFGFQDSDPTNLYLANLPAFMVEHELEAMLQPYGNVVSTRVLRDGNHKSRGVGFARMQSKEVCDKVIETLNGKIAAGCQEALVVKFADSGNRRRQQNRERGWNRMDQHLGGLGYDQLGGGQNGLAGSMLTSIRYSVPQAASLAAYQAQWQPQYTILPQQMTQMVQGVDGGPAYSVSQLAAQMSQLGLSPYNSSPYAQYGFNPQLYQAGMAQMQGNQAGQGDDQQNGSVQLDGNGMPNVQHSQQVNNMVQGQPNMAAVYGAYSQQK